MPTTKTKARRNDPEQFYLSRRRAGLTHTMAAAMLHVTTRTLRNWENGSIKIPYAAYRLMRLFGGHSLIGKQWEGWSMWRGMLWTPEGRGFEAHELRYIANYLWMARKFLADRRQAAENPNPKTLLIPPSLADGVNAASAASSARPHQDLHSLSLKVAGQQGKNIVMRAAQNWFQIGTIDAPEKMAANDDIELEVL